MFGHPIPEEHQAKIDRYTLKLTDRLEQVALAALADRRAGFHSSLSALVLTAVGGFDTHTDQLESHEWVLRELGDGLAAFQRELEERAVAERVLLMAWSEFGRRPA
ncbi:MAG TPA: DUF1501 domain-containing protein [Phycisphaerae bacterium]|nr:DUF1501 domain-containing protein [Phycisphaerae bacterium]